MFNAIWRFLVYRLAGGRFLLALTVVNWLWRRISRDKSAPPPSAYIAPDPNRSQSQYRAPR